jgi:L-aminopeptidase/D-esterase-like protein
MLAGTVAPPTRHTNTTLGVIVTNVAYDKTEMTRLAMMAQNGLARTIRPVHTSFDGDAVFALSVGDVVLPAAALDALGSLAALVMGKAINNAVRFV